MSKPSVAIVTLGCARNEVDSEEVAAALAQDGWELTDDPEAADTVLVNTCGFIDEAKADSIETVLELQDVRGKVVAIGCMAERYGDELAAELPEADAVLGFDAYPDLPQSLRTLIAGGHLSSHTPVDRRTLQPASPTQRSGDLTVLPGHVGMRRRLTDGPFANVKLASGCDRRCTFCAIPSFRGAFVSRRPTDVINEVRWLADQGVLEVNLVSENSTSYGKDLGDFRLLEKLLPELATTGVERVRVAYLQPAEMRPELIRVIGTTIGVAPYFDLSFQHASAQVLRRMRRFGSERDFLTLLDQIRTINPDAGVRSNFIIGFPGETDEDFRTLLHFLEEARLDAIGLFTYSEEQGTEAATFTDTVDTDVVDERFNEAVALVEELMDQRGQDRIGQTVRVITETSRNQFQGPEDGVTRLTTETTTPVVVARVVASEGPDLIAEIQNV